MAKAGLQTPVIPAPPAPPAQLDPVQKVQQLTKPAQQTQQVLHFKPEFSGKPEEDAKLICFKIMIGWMHVTFRRY